MTGKKIKPDSPDLTSEACAWIAQLETGMMSHADKRAFGEWINRSPAHYSEIHRLAVLSAEINGLTQLAAPIRNAAKEQRSAISGPASRSKNRSLWLAACTLLAVGAIGFFLSDRSNESGELYSVATNVGEIRERTLPDGSTMMLNTDSRVEIDFDRRERRVLLHSGEVFFDVTHNPARPFDVHVGDKIVRAVGTAFSVRWTDGELSITVSEGQVAFAPPGELPPLRELVASPPQPAVRRTPDGQQVSVVSIDQPFVVNAGQKFVLPRDHMRNVIATLPDSRIQSDLAWQAGLMVFTERPLVEIVNEMNRYTNLHIEITDPALSSEKYTGVFAVGEVDELLDALELKYDVEVDRLDNDHVIIHGAGT